MSTDLYGIRILDVKPEEKRIRMRVFVVYYDTHYEYHQPVPDDRSFFVRVLCDKEALGEDISDDQRFDEGYVNANAFRYVDRFDMLEERNVPVEDYTEFHDFYYERDGGWVNEENLVQADFDVWVTKSEYLTPFSEGDTWGTTSYQTESDPLTIDDYPHVPEIEPISSFVPFGDLDQEETVADSISFSLDGKRVVFGNGEGGVRVYKTSDWSMEAEYLAHGHWVSTPSFDLDGNVVLNTGEAWEVVDFENQTTTPIDRTWGFSANATADRFVNGFDEEGARIFDDQGNVLFETEKGYDLTVRASFDPANKFCALNVESADPVVVNLETKTTSTIPTRARDMAISPNGQYVSIANYQLISVFSIDGRCVRREQRNDQLAVATAWSPDGETVLFSRTDNHGYNSTISVHKIGSVFQALQNATVVVPEPSDVGLPEIAQLYLRQTQSFKSGWNSHLDDDLLDFHGVLVAIGADVDLVSSMNTDATKIAARSYETQIRSRAGDDDGATHAFEQALEILKNTEEQPWWSTYVYAPLAAAAHVLGHKDATKYLKKALVELENESNGFQKRAILGRAYLEFGKLDEVKALIDGSSGRTWQFHQRLLRALIDHEAFDLLDHALDHWEIDSSTHQFVSDALVGAGYAKRAATIEWDETDDRALVRAFRAWMLADAPAALEELQAKKQAEPNNRIFDVLIAREDPSTAYEIYDRAITSWSACAHYVTTLFLDDETDLALRGWSEISEDNRQLVAQELHQLGLADRLPDVTDEAESIYHLGLAGEWERVYATIDATKRTLRDPLLKDGARAALDRGDGYIVHDLVGRLPCKDMNSVGLRALQNAFRTLAGHTYRMLHP